MSENQEPSTQRGKAKYAIIKPVPIVRPMTPEETGMLDRIANMIHLPPAQERNPVSSNTGHIRENFDTRAMAQVARQFGKDDALIVGGITLALTIGLYWFVPGDVTLYGLGWLVVWGAISLFSMNRTRSQAYLHSPTGVALRDSDNEVAKHMTDAEVEIHRINTAAEVARHAIDATSKTMLARWQIERGRDDAE